MLLEKRPTNKHERQILERKWRVHFIEATMAMVSPNPWQILILAIHCLATPTCIAYLSAYVQEVGSSITGQQVNSCYLVNADVIWQIFRTDPFPISFESSGDCFSPRLLPPCGSAQDTGSCLYPPAIRPPRDQSNSSLLLQMEGTKAQEEERHWFQRQIRLLKGSEAESVIRKQRGYHKTQKGTEI